MKTLNLACGSMMVWLMSGVVLAAEPVVTGPSGGMVRSADDVLAMSAPPQLDLEAQNGRGIDSLGITNQLSQADMNAGVSNTVLSHSISGTAVLSGGALGGMNGIASVIQNTGNQVVIQSSTILNLSLH